MPKCLALSIQSESSDDTWKRSIEFLFESSTTKGLVSTQEVQSGM